MLHALIVQGHQECADQMLDRFIACARAQYCVKINRFVSIYISGPHEIEKNGKLWILLKVCIVRS